MNVKRFVKGFSSVILVLMLAVLFALPASAEGVLTIGASVQHVEGGGYLTAEEENELEELAASASESAGMGIYVFFTNTPALDEELAALSLLKEKIAAGGGYGEANGAVILYVDMNTRNYAVVEKDDTPKGRLSAKFIEKQTSDGSKIRSLLTAKDNFNAAKTFINNVKSELVPGFFQSIWFKLLAALGIGGAAAGIGVGSHKALPKTRKRHYLKDNTVAVVQKNERLTGTTIQRNTASKSTNGADHKVGGDAHGGSNSF